MIPHMMKEENEDNMSSLEGLSLFGMDFASKGLSWGESICQKLDNAIQDNLIVQNPSMFVDALGDHLRKIYVGVADDWLSPFADGSIEDAKPDSVKDMKVTEKTMKALGEQLTEERTSNTGLDTINSSGHHTLVPSVSMPQNASFKESMSGVCRNIISVLEPPQQDSSNVIEKGASLPSALNIQCASLREMSEVCRSSIVPPVEPTQHEFSTVTGCGSSPCLSPRLPQDVSSEETFVEHCRNYVCSPVDDTQNEFSTTKEVPDEENTEQIASRADSNLCSVTQPISTSNESKVTTEQESSGIPKSDMTPVVATDLNTEAITIEEFEDVELEDVKFEDGWDDSVLNEILLISHCASNKAFHKKKLGILAAIASRFRSEKKNDDQILTWIYANCRHSERKRVVDCTSDSRDELNSISSSDSIETCESDWELL